MTRYRSALERLDRLGLRPGIALRRTFAAGYGRRDLLRDALAGLVVGVVALPLSMALAIASGVPPQHGRPAWLALRIAGTAQRNVRPS